MSIFKATAGSLKNFQSQTDAHRTVYIPSNASPLLEASAQELIDKLAQATGLQFYLEIGGDYTGKGFYLALRSHGTLAPLPDSLAQMGEEAIYIVGTKEGVQMVGNSDLAVQEAVYSYLEKIGFRYYFPNEAWHIIPKDPQLFYNFTILTQPDYASRRIFYGGGTDSKIAEVDFKNWNKYNRMGGAFYVNTVHAYERIVARNKSEFELHPEYFAKNADGSFSAVKAKQKKFCQSTEGLVQLVIKDALQQIEQSLKKGQVLKMVSMEPSDGRYYCECTFCRKLGTPTDRVFYLANRVAKEVEKKYPGTWVGLNAYAEHAEPSNIELEPNVFVMIATAFNHTEYSINELIQEWGKRAKKIGVRDYYGVFAWDFNMPGSGKKIGNIKNGIYQYHRLGATVITAETTIGWISRGLGHYIASKLLWDTDVDIKEITEDFYEKAFGCARKPMQQLYESWQQTAIGTPTAYQIAQWYDLTRQGLQLSCDFKERQRIEQVQAYLHYVALFYNWKTAIVDNKSKSFSNLLSYSHQIKDLGICASYPLARWLARNSEDQNKFNFRDKEAVWKKYTLTDSELNTLAQSFLDRLKDVIPVKEYSPNFIRIKNPRPLSSNILSHFRGRHEFVLMILYPSEYAFLEVRSDLLKGNKKTTVQISALQDHADPQLVLTTQIPGDKKMHRVNLKTLKVGLYRVIINDNNSRFSILTGKDISLSVIANQQHKLNTWKSNSFSFYVPSDTKRFEIVWEGAFTLVSPSGRIIESKELTALSSMIKVRANESGLWQLIRQRGSFYLNGLPPFIGIGGQAILVPEM